MKMGTLFIVLGATSLIIGMAINASDSGKNTNKAVEKSEVSTESKKTPSEEEKPKIEAISTENKESSKISKSEIKESVEIVQKEPERSAKEKGNDFEDFMAEIFVGSGIRMKEWNKGSATSSGAIADNALNPDFFLELTTDKKPIEFWVECKYRSDLSKGITLPDYQIKRYRAKQRESRRKIFLAIATDGAPSAPESLYIVPLDSFKNEGMNREDLKSFYMSEPQKNFRGRIYNYFMNKVFKK